MKWLFVIDSLARLNPDTDTTLAIMEECARRKIPVEWAEITDLFFDGCVKVRSERYKSKPEKKTIYALDEFDIILMRKEPPYDLNFHYATQLLSLTIAPVVNTAQSLRDFNEKLIILNFLSLIPPTIVSSNHPEIMHFMMRFEDVVMKSLDSFQGKSVVKINSKDIASNTVVSRMTKKETTPVIVQEFLPAVLLGDKRILLLGGKILGAVNRVPKQGSFLANFGQGGIGIKTTLTDNDHLIVEAVGPYLVSKGIHFAGLDVIGGKLTEINITCPTGVRQINALEQRNIEKDIVEYFLQIKT